MQTKLYAVTAATGQIGSQIVASLLAQGHQVRALSRDAKKLDALVALGAEARIGASDDVAYLADAFRGADAVFTLLPPDYGAADFRAAQNRVGVAQLEALQRAGTKKVVNLSSTGAQLVGGKTGPIAGLTDQEQRLATLKGVDLVNLRPTYFMENLAFSLEPIKHMNVVGSPLTPETRIPMIATKDIADRAVELLVSLNFRGHANVEILGERDVTMVEVTAALAKTLNRPSLSYVQFPYADAQAAMVGSGLSADTAARMVEMYKAYNEGVLVPSKARNVASTTKTTIESFVVGFARAMGL